jgi:PAS domain S-box-containing protein
VTTPPLTYEELQERLQEAEAVLLSLMSAETDAIVSRQGVYVLRPNEADRTVRAAREALERMLNQRTTQLRQELDRTKQVAAELRDSEQRFRTLAQAVPILLWSTNAAGHATYVSARYEEFTGFSASELLGEGWLKVLHPDDKDRVLSAWTRTVQNGAPFEDEYRLRRFDGSFRWFVGRGIPLRDETSSINQWLGSSAEVDAIKRTEAALRRSNDELRQFAYAAAHDLQEPLRNISTSVGMIKQRHGHTLSSDVAEWFESAYEGAQRMHGMVKDLLAFTRAVGGEEQPAQLFDPKCALDLAMTNLRGQASASGMEVEVEALPKVRVYPHHLVQVFQNLISNAIKYRHPDRPLRIHVSGASNTAECQISISDNGIGFDPAYSERIFGVFRRLHTRKEYEGNGIGLAICARVIGYYGGRIWAEGEPGRGAAFHFTLPRA